MMNEDEKSDPAIVAVTPANKAERSAAEWAEPRAGTEGNADERNTFRAQNREDVSQSLDRVRQAAKERKKEKFTALFHHINIDLLEEAFYELKEDAAPGVDRLTWKDYEAKFERNLEDLHDRVQRGAYRALPSRRVYIPKPDGRQRPLAVAALEDKIVQRATATVLNAIYEEDFLGFSYGFRPRRGAHDALDALAVGIGKRKVNYILDADTRSFFDEHEWFGLDPDQVVHVNAHATSTPEGDALEAQALAKALGAAADGVIVSSTKSMTGHTLGAAGALEAVFCVQALNHQTLPPTINYETPDPECDLDYVPNTARPSTFDVAMTNSFGFGGHNATLVFTRL